MREWFTTRAAADLDILPSLQLWRDRSRDLARNDPLASGAISTVVENVIGTGLSLQARPDVDALKMTDDERETWTETVEREFRLWSDTTDRCRGRTGGLGSVDYRGFPPNSIPGRRRPSGAQAAFSAILKWHG
jgi:capsid protein